MAARLIEVAAEAEQTREHPIKEDQYLIGRGSDCNLRLPISDVSRHHCLIQKQANEYFLSDLGSANGTFVNGKRVRSKVTLRTGDQISIGPLHFLVDLGDGDSLPSLPGADAMASTMHIKDMDYIARREIKEEKP